jgi:hypothetical protein
MSPQANSPSVKEGEKIQGKENRSAQERLVFLVKDSVKTIMHIKTL